MKYIYNYKDDYDENPFDLDERNFDEKYKCDICGERLIKGRESYSAWGSDFSINVWQCQNGCC